MLRYRLITKLSTINLKYLLNDHDLHIIDHLLSYFSINKLFEYSCHNGQLQTARKLWELSNHSIDLHADCKGAFSWSCRNGHLEIAKWLWELSNHTIDLHAENENAL